MAEEADQPHYITRVSVSTREGGLRKAIEVTKRRDRAGRGKGKVSQNVVEGSQAELIVQARRITGGVNVIQRDSTPVAKPPIPQTLPPSVRLVGRTGIDRSISIAVDRRRAPRVAVLSGPPGIGKTAAAVAWATRHARSFPDGQLYLDLHGFGPTGQPLTPARAAQILLDQLGVDHRSLPRGSAELGHRLRQLLSNKRILVVLDNAADSEQVVPLLAASSGCATLVTSRESLAGILVKGARMVKVTPLDSRGSKDFLMERLGRDWLNAGPDAVTALITMCGGNPLALSILAARVATSPALSASLLRKELERQSPLTVLSAGSEQADLATVFSWSMTRLSPEATRTFAAIGGLGTPHVDGTSIAAFLDAPRSRVDSTLHELEGANLIYFVTGESFGVHDLLSQYAVDIAESTWSPTERAVFLQSYLNRLAADAYAAERALYPLREDLRENLRPRGEARAFTSYDEALDWFRERHERLVSGVQQAAHLNLNMIGWRLAWACTTFLDRSGYWDDYASTQSLAASMANELGDQPAEASSRRYLATALQRQGNTLEAGRQLEASMTLARGDASAEARTALALAFHYGDTDQPHLALSHALDAEQRYRTLGDEVARARALSFVAWFRNVDDPGNPDSVREIAEAIGSLERVNHRWELGHATYHQGMIHASLPDATERALEAFRASESYFDQLGDDFLRARSLLALGDQYLALGKTSTNFENANEAWRVTLRLLESLGPTFTQEVLQRLDSIPDS